MVLVAQAKHLTLLDLILKQSDNILYGGFRAEDQRQHSSQNDDDVLDDLPVELAETFVPEGQHLDHDRHHQSQDGKAEGADQTDERYYRWYRYGDQHAHGHQNRPEDVVGEGFPLDELVLHLGPRDVEAHVELEAVGAEDCDADEDVDSLGETKETSL